MTEQGGQDAGRAPGAAKEWLAAVSSAAAKDAGTAEEYLGQYLRLLENAALAGRRLQARDLDQVAVLGRQAAERGVPADRVVDLYLSAAWRLWRELPSVSRSDNSKVVHKAAEAVLRVVDDAVAALVEGYQAARRHMIRREEALRRELVDDLLRGDSDVAGLVERGEPFGVDLGIAHQVVLAAPSRRLPDSEPAVSSLERSVLDLFGDREVLVATKDGLVVVIAPPSPAVTTPRPARRQDLAQVVLDELTRLGVGASWRVAEGRPYPGAYGIARSYEEAREALLLADRLHSDASLVRARDLLVYRVLVRDHVAITDLVDTVLTPLLSARGGAEPLLETLEAYFATGEVATDAARRLHLSVRAVTYRLGRIKALTGYAPSVPADRFTLYTAVLGARLLGWPGGRTDGPGAADQSGR